jgi:TonB family protein
MLYLASPIPDRRRTLVSFGASGSVHAAILVWLAIGGARLRNAPPRSVYDQEIGPYENHLVWYNLREKLPDIAPSAEPAAAQRPRAQRRFPQTLVSGPKDDARPSQMIRTESPPAELPKPAPLPNVVAASSRPKPPRLFLPPPETPPPPAEAPSLADSPLAEVEPPVTASPLEVSTPRPKPRPFQPLPDRKPALPVAPTPDLPEAPRVAAAKPQPTPAPLGVSAARPKPLPFQEPPPLERPRPAPVSLAEPPPVETARLPAPDPALASAPPRPRARPFQAPAAPAPSAPAPSAPAPPTVLSETPAPAAGVPPPPAARIPRGFASPPPGIAPQAAAPALAAIPPAVSAPAGPAADSFAIASLDPSKLTEIPPSLPSHPAGFSGAPEVHPESAGPASNDQAALVVPSLTAGSGVRDALPTLAPSPEVSARVRLLAELRTPISPTPAPRAAPGGLAAPRVSSAPDPRLDGRVVYAMAIQMPNVTSYSGSWMVWFAERAPLPGSPPSAVRPPEPRHKVDPAYIRSAADEGIQGTIRLAAVIGRDGRVDRIELIRGIDNRLDESAVQALGKWLFEPATRDGVPIEVDAVFEVPFRLAPRPSR